MARKTPSTPLPTDWPMHVHTRPTPGTHHHPNPPHIPFPRSDPNSITSYGLDSCLKCLNLGSTTYRVPQCSIPGRPAGHLFQQALETQIGAKRQTLRQKSLSEALQSRWRIGPCQKCEFSIFSAASLINIAVVSRICAISFFVTAS